MSFSKKWMIAGAAAGLLVAGSTLAGDRESSNRSDGAYGAGDEAAAAVKQSNEGSGSGEPVVRARPDDRSQATGRAERNAGNADRAAASDADEVAKGNTGGRG